MQISKKR